MYFVSILTSDYAINVNLYFYDLLFRVLRIMLEIFTLISGHRGEMDNVGRTVSEVGAIGRLQ